MPTPQNPYPRYRVTLGTSGIEVEAPTKDECVKLLEEVSKFKIKGHIDEAIR
jgi:hypothetical protein